MQLVVAVLLLITVSAHALKRCLPAKVSSSSSRLQMTEYGPVFDPTVMYSMVGVTGVLGVTTAVWWNQVIPQKRLEVAKSKRKGEIKDYLDDLREAGEVDEKSFERWLMTDWLEKVPGSDKPAAIPFIKKVKWNSGDNPVLVAFGGIMACVMAAALAERGSALLGN